MFACLPYLALFNRDVDFTGSHELLHVSARAEILDLLFYKFMR
jgi:hypothetical protein